MPDIIKISELDEALALADAAEFPYYQDNGGQNTTYKAPMTQIGAKIVEGLTYQGINLPAGAGNKTVENSLNYLLNAVGGDPNGNISDSYDPTAAYVKGDLCIYENVLYICTAPTTGTFDPSKWTATTIDNVIGSLSQLTTSVTSSLVGAVNEVNGKGYNDLSGRPIRNYMVSSSNPITIQGQIVAGYATFIIIGFVASLGGVVLAVQMSNGNLSKVIDLLTGNPFSSSHLTFSGSNSQLTIASDVNSNSNLMVWG